VSEPVQTLLNAAYEARAAGQRAQGRQAYGDALSAARQVDDVRALAHALRHVSDMDREDGRSIDALEAAREAVALYRPWGEAAALELANALRLQALAQDDLGQPSEAIWGEARLLFLSLKVEAGVSECDQRLPERHRASGPGSAP